MSKANKQFEDKCRQWWTDADSDGNNALTIQELAKMIRAVAPNVDISDSDIAAMFLDLDDDGSKTLTFDEFADTFRKKDPKKIQENELMEGFKEMDKSGDGVLTVEEIRAQYAKLEIDISDEAFEATVSNFDKDGDGKINFKEFCKLWGSQ